ncbi:unnamed protein product, partial [marine sediment metagenome]
MAFKAGSVIGEAILDDGKWTGGTKNIERSNKGMIKSIFTAQLAYDAFKKVLFSTINVTKQSIKNAIDFQETQNKFNVIFSKNGKVMKQAVKAQKNLAKNYGLSNKAATKLLASTGDLLTGLGFQKEEALELSESVQEL